MSSLGYGLGVDVEKLTDAIGHGCWSCYPAVWGYIQMRAPGNQPRQSWTSEKGSHTGHEGGKRVNTP